MQHRRLEANSAEEIGVSPIEGLPIEMGSYILNIELDGYHTPFTPSITSVRITLTTRRQTESIAHRVTAFRNSRQMIAMYCG